MTGSYYAYFIQTTSGGKLLLGLENTRGVVGFLYNGLGLALLPALYALGRTFSPPQIVRDWRSRFLLLWLLPPLAFYILVHIGNPGYVLSFLPPVHLQRHGHLRLLRGPARAVTLLGAGRLWPAPPVPPPVQPGLGGPAATATLLAVGAVNGGLFLSASGRGAPARDPPDRPHPGAPDRRGAAGLPARFERHLRLRSLPAVPLLPPWAQDRAAVRRRRGRGRDRHQPLLGAAPGVPRPARGGRRPLPDLDRNISDTPGLVQAVDLGEGVSLYVARVQPGDEVRYGYQYASVGPGQ